MSIFLQLEQFTNRIYLLEVAKQQACIRVCESEKYGDMCTSNKN